MLSKHLLAAYEDEPTGRKQQRVLALSLKICVPTAAQRWALRSAGRPVACQIPSPAGPPPSPRSLSRRSLSRGRRGGAVLLPHSEKEFRLSVWRFGGSNSGRMGPKVGLKVCPASCQLCKHASSTRSGKKILDSPLFGKTIDIKMGPIPLLPLSLCTLSAVALATGKLHRQARAKSSLFIFN